MKAVVPWVFAAAASVGSAPIDGFSPAQWAQIREMRLPPGPPADPTNRVADDPRAVALGRALFVDRCLSPSGRVSCLSCHDPGLLFTNGKDTAAEGVGPGDRNVPSLILASHGRWLLWDGRADSLWAQAVMPFEDPREYGSSRLFVAHAVGRRHREAYEALFGSLPDLGRLPDSGKPGDAPWDGLAETDQRAVSSILANVGKAIAAFERSFRVKAAPIDRYADGDLAALTDSQKQGLRAFLDAGCVRCHSGPRFTDDAFHNLRFPTGRKDLFPDPGRAEGIALYAVGEFQRSGPHSDRAEAPRDPGPALVGAFKTPGLRGVAYTMPYGHGGGFGGLTSALEAHRSGGVPPASRFALGKVEAVPFAAEQIAPIVEFLKALTLDIEDPGLPGESASR